MSVLLSAEQVLTVLGRLEPEGLSYRQLRDLEARRCVEPRVLPGGRGPRLYDAGDVMLLRLVARMQADGLPTRWACWAVVANLRDALRAVLLSGAARTLVIQGARGVIVSAREAERLPGVSFELSDVSRGVLAAMRAESGDVWTGFRWMPAREAEELVEAFA